MAELKYKDITEKIIGASFEVHKFFGNGFQEVIYQRALAWELSRGLLMQEKLNRIFFTKNFLNLLEREGPILL
jgi:GxxExxY protein